MYSVSKVAPLQEHTYWSTDEMRTLQANNYIKVRITQSWIKYTRLICINIPKTLISELLVTVDCKEMLTTCTYSG